MTNPLISVIVPLRNAMPFLPEALSSIFAQDIEPIEVLVVDGASTDGSREAAAAFPQIRLIDQEGRGLAAARNTGLDAAQGDYIAFLDADDLWTAGSLAARFASLRQRPDCAAVSGRVVRFLHPGTPLPPAYADGWLNQPVAGYTPGALLARRILFEQVGSFDESLAVGCDSDWFMRVHDSSLPFTFVPDVVLHKRIHDANLSANVVRYQRELLAATRRSLQRRGIV